LPCYLRTHTALTGEAFDADGRQQFAPIVLMARR
jgi:hypothetical protein